MTQVLTASQMRAVEKAAIDSGQVTGLALMERAGRGVVDAIFDEWPDLAKTSFRAVVLCGPGNNGGDGFVVARLLKQRGWQVDVFLFGDPDRLPADARQNYANWQNLGTTQAWNDKAIKERLDASDHDLVVDALFGTGLTRAMPDDTTQTLHAILPRVLNVHPSERPKYVAVDIPSGLCSDSGRNLGGAWPADLTVSFHCAKVGHVLAPQGPPQGGAPWCGRVVVHDIGLDPRPVKGAARICAPLTSALAKAPTGHKYSHGHALILSGPSAKTGAARLAARGALRIGAGLVTLGCPNEALAESAAHMTAIMLAQIGDTGALDAVLKDERINALCLGPGFGIERACAYVPPILSSGRATVLDADALSALSQRPALMAGLHEHTVLTPHAGEFARLFPDIAERLQGAVSKGPAYSKVDATRDAAKRARCVVLFKGPATVIAAPDGHCAINPANTQHAAPWLATAGAGDVLAGFVTGLLARGFAPMQAAQTAVWLHTACARAFGPGLIAEDLPELLPQVLRDIGA
ncbi:NAD(P)H-hydrate dehydratase [Aliiroseovarius sp. PTFE2010]|uniref:NAD(P)H-hydrate dehydratase n=1 Tax=Aliiroseovarius sp. PTFE2010 TaxID=3417190 RepID=UPI003CEB3B2A